MDSYTDVRGQCCGCRHVSCNTSGPSGRGSFRQTEYPDMNTFPWAVNNDYNVAPAESFAGGQYTGMNQMDCVSTEPGCLEQQHPVAMAAASQGWVSK